MIIGIAPDADDVFDFHIPVADVGEAQRRSSRRSRPSCSATTWPLLRGHDPDKPRNLAKSVTVK